MGDISTYSGPTHCDLWLNNSLLELNYFISNPFGHNKSCFYTVKQIFVFFLHFSDVVKTSQTELPITN